jgi:hypothetical protein
VIVLHEGPASEFSTAAFGKFSDIFKEGVVRSSLYTVQGVYLLYRPNFFA